jgi:hypothetical protein
MIHLYDSQRKEKASQTTKEATLPGREKGKLNKRK